MTQQLVPWPLRLFLIVSVVALTVEWAAVIAFTVECAMPRKLTQQLVPRLLGGSDAKPAVGSTAVLGDVDPALVIAMAKDQNASHLVEVNLHLK